LSEPERIFWRLNLHRSALIAILLVVAILEALGGCKTPPDSAKKHSESLLIAPSAINPRYLAYPDGREQLTYMLDTEYPADSTISFISAELQKRRWEPLHEDFLNPGIPTSEVRGWAQFEDRSEEPRATVRQWACDWEDGAHNITTYSLRYRSPMNGAHDPRDTRMLHIAALYIPAAVAERMKHATKPDQPKK
jgi:hypothetical protein